MCGSPVSLDSVHIYGPATYSYLDIAMASDTGQSVELSSGGVSQVTTSVGPYKLHLDVQKLDDGGYEVFGKGVEQTRPMLLGSDVLGPVSNTIHSMLYRNLVRKSYEVGTVLTESQVQSMRS